MKQKQGTRTSKALDSALHKAARAAGKLHGKTVRQSLRDAAAAKGDFSKSMRKGLQRLQAQQQITSSDAEQLREIGSALGGKATVEETLRRVRSIYKDLLKKRGASPVAVAIAGIAVDSLKTTAGSGSVASAASSGTGVAQADVTGALIGGVVGLTVGALVGAIAGAGVGLGPGAAVGAVAGAVAGGAAASAQKQAS